MKIVRQVNDWLCTLISDITQNLVSSNELEPGKINVFNIPIKKNILNS